MRFILVGPNKGKSGVWGGYRFVNGVCVLKTEHDVECATRILPSFYSAWPEDVAEAKQAEYEDAQRSLGIDPENLPPPAAQPAQTIPPQEEEEQIDDGAEAGQTEPEHQEADAGQTEADAGNKGKRKKKE
jgi:hypothetical protein